MVATLDTSYLSDLARVRLGISDVPDGTYRLQRSTNQVRWFDVRGGRELEVTQPNVGLKLDGESGNYASTPDDASLDITGDIDLRAEATLDDWALDGTLIAKWETNSTDLEWLFGPHSSGGLRLLWTEDGFSPIEGNVVSDPLPITSGRLAVRATLDVDDAGDHTVRFYTAPSIDGPWTQLGSADTTAGTTSIFAGTSDVSVGAHMDDGSAGNLTGTVHAVQARDGIDGTVVANPVFAEEDTGTTNFTDSAGRSWTVQGDASIVGPPDAWAEVDDYEWRDSDVNHYRLLGIDPPAGLWLDGTVGAYASTPDAASLDITGDVVLAGEATIPDWDATKTRTLVAKYGTTADQRSYRLILHNNRLRINWSEDGIAQSTAESSAAPVPDASGRLAVRVWLDVDDGSGDRKIIFYTAPSLDGPWTQLGNPQVQSGTTSIFAGTAELEIGATDSGGSALWDGTIHRALIIDGNLSGTLVADPVFEDQTTDATSFDDTQGLTWTINGRARIIGNPVVTDTITPDLAGQVWLKSLRWPFLNRAVTVVNDTFGIQRDTRDGVFEIPGRSHPVVVFDKRRSPQFTLELLTDTDEQARDMDLILAASGPMFIHTPAGSTVPGGHVRIGRTSQDPATDGGGSPEQVFTLPCRVIAPPGPDVVGGTLTWGQVELLYAAWTNLENATAAWRVLLDTVGDPDSLVVL